MNRISWGRIAVFGLLAGAVWTLLSSAVLAVFGTDFVAALPARSAAVRVFLLAANAAAGIWAMWLYALIRGQYGRGLKAATITGVGWWLIQSLQSSKWVALGSVPMQVTLGPAIGTLPAMIVATAIGAWCYENYQSPTFGARSAAT